MALDLREFILDLNAAWREGRYESLYDFFHQDAGLLAPGLFEPVIGVEPIVASYRQFGSMAALHDFEIQECLVRRYDNVAICLIRFEIEYEMEGRRFREAGLEQYVVDIAQASPKILWRVQLPLDSEAG